MEDIFTQASLSYLTNRCDEGFELIYFSLIKCSNEIYLNWEERQVFCLISMNIIEKRYKSWKTLNRQLSQRDDRQERKSIEYYIDMILNEINSYSNRIFDLIENYLFKSSPISSEVKIFYLKLVGDIHFLLSQISKLETKLDHFLSSLHFYNQSLEVCSQSSLEFSSIIYNKCLV